MRELHGGQVVVLPADDDLPGRPDRDVAEVRGDGLGQRQMQVLGESVRARYLELAEPTLQDQASDLERMGAGVVELLESMDGGWGMLLDLYKAVADQS